MIKVEKRNIYWFFIYPLAALTFVVLSVLFILSAKGYSVHFENNTVKFEKTGMLIVSTKPTGADILMDGKNTTKKTTAFFSVKIDRLSKGKYTLVLEKEGYYKWEKEVKISPEMVTWANYVLLFSKKPKIEKTDFIGTLVESIPSQDHKASLLLTKTKDSEVLYKMQNSSGEKTSLLDTIKLAEDKRLSDIKIVNWSKDHRYVLVLGTLKGDRRYWTINTESKSVDDLTSLSPVKFERMAFNTSNSEELYGSFSGDLVRLNLRTKSVSGTLDNHVVYFTFSTEGKLYYIKDGGGTRSLWQTNADLNGKVDLSDAIPVSDAYEAKVSSKNQRVALSVKNSSLLYLVTKVGEKNSLITLGKNVTDFAWSQDGERLFYKEQNSNIVVLEDDGYKKETQEYEAIDTNAHQDISWYDSRHLLSRNGDKVMIMDFDGTNRIVLGDTLSGRRPFSSADNGDIFFFSTSTNPEQTLLSWYKVDF